MAKIEIHAWYRQYRKLKAQAADAILLFRFGDFYETFDDDAKLVAELLDVTLTRKDYAVDKSKPRESQKLYAPMAGMPYHAVERYVSDLVGRGYRVAIAEQISETEATRTDTRPRSVFAAGIQHVAPGESERRMVHREIVRVITPGTIVDLSMLTATSNNYLAAAIVEGDSVGLAYADLSTGEFAAVEFSGERAAQHLQGELARLQAAEVLVPDVESLRLPGLAPAEARLTRDLAPMTKDERELLLPHERVARRLDSQSEARWACGHVTAWPAWRWDLAEARDVLLRQLRVGALSAFGLDDRPLAARAAGALVQYVHATQRHQAAQLTTLRVYASSSFMFLDPQTRRNLELLEASRQGARSSLVHVLDRTRTPMGARLLRRWIAQPLVELAPLQARQAAVARLVEQTLLRAELRDALGPVGDMERALNRIAQGVAVATPRDLVQLRASLRALPAVVAAAGAYLTELITLDMSPEQQPAAGADPAQGDEADTEDELFADRVEPPAPSGPQPAAHAPVLDPCSDVLDLLERALDDDPPALLGASNYLRAAEESNERPRRVIRPGFEPRIDALVRASRHAQEFIDRLEVRERDRTGIKSLKVGYNSVFGYYIEVSRNADERLIPQDYERKQTLVGAERYITAELKEYEQIIDRARLQLTDLERETFARLCAEVSAQVERLRHAARTLAHLDVVQSLAEAAVRGGYARPTLDESTRLHIVAGRHPVVEQMLAEPFVANDVTLATDDAQLLIITGPNMAGKCVSGETLIFTDQGLVPLAALMPAQAAAGAFTPIACAVKGRQARRQATHFYRGGRQATIRITTRHGYQLEGTAEHRVWARFPDGREGWRYLGELGTGDMLAIDRQINLWGNQDAIAPPAGLPEAVRAHLPTRLTPELAYLIGRLIAAGTLTDHNGSSLVTGDRFIADQLRRIAWEQAGYQAPANGQAGTIASRLVRAFVHALGLEHCPAHEQRVPAAIMRAPRSVVVGFLQGLCDTNGSANRRTGAVRLSIASPRLAHEVQLLLLNLGIIAARRAQATSHQLVVSGHDALHFHEQIGFRHPRRQRRAAAVWAAPAPQPGAGPPLQLPKSLRGWRRWPSPPPLTRPPRSRPNYYYDTIISTEAGETEVYDLSVAEEHAYVANGLVSHNSTVLRQVALIVLMAQIGSFVPAAQAEVGLVDRIFTRIGAQDDIATGQSTFMVEMTETAALLLQSTRRSLIILDEVGRGTSTYDGMAIARAVVEYLHNEPRLRCRTLFATHYHELTALEELLPRVRNYHMAAVEQDGQVVFLHELRPGGADRSYGIHVAELAGIPRAVTTRASELLAELEGRRAGGRQPDAPAPAEPAPAADADDASEPGAGAAPVHSGPRAGASAAAGPSPRRERRPASNQLSLFDVAPSPVLEYLRRLNINELTPLEALNLLHELQKLAGEG